jgi:hypothetical protein
MLRLLFCLLSCSLFSISLFSAAAAFAQPELTTDAEQAMQESILLESTAPEYSPLEYQIITDSGLLSLAEQVKYSAQRMIAESSEEQLESQSASGNAEQDAGIAEKIIPINHAQHFAIAKSLAKNWTQAIWQQRLLKLVHSIPLEKQQLIQQQLSMPMILQAQKKEQAAISVQHSVEYQLYMNKLRQRPPSAARWQLVESLDQQSGFSRLIIQARKVVFNQIALQVEGWKPGEFWQNQARQEVLEFLFYAYRKTPNAELKHITDSYNQEELKSLFTTVGNNL